MNKDVVIRAAIALHVALLVAAAPTWAHHSFAVYDVNQTKSAEGVIREFNGRMVAGDPQGGGPGGPAPGGAPTSAPPRQ